jgi:hypothetical protein
MPEGLHARLRKEARANKRSVNREIVRRLEVSFSREDEAKLFRRQMEDAAKTLAAALGPAALATLERALTTERDIIESALNDNAEEGRS